MNYKALTMSNKAIAVRAIILLLVAIVVFGLTFIKEDYSYLDPKSPKIKDCKYIESLILNGDLSVQSNGCVVLPKGYEHLSDSGECFIKWFRNYQTAIYFFKHRGILGSSRGYLYVTDKFSYKDFIDLDVYTGTSNFVNVKKIKENLYSCSTK